jgi:hypothetical protein
LIVPHRDPWLTKRPARDQVAGKYREYSDAEAKVSEQVNAAQCEDREAQRCPSLAGRNEGGMGLGKKEEQND